MKKGKMIKRVLPLLCATLLLLGSSVTVFAHEITYCGQSFDFPYSLSQVVSAIERYNRVDLSQYDIRYFVIIQEGTTEPLQVTVYVSNKPIIKRISVINDEVCHYIYTEGHCGTAYYKACDGIFEFAGSNATSSGPGSGGLKSVVGTSEDLIDCILYSNQNIYDENNVLFFQQPLPVVLKAIQTAQLPEVIQGQVKTILPIAVGCLALVIGSIVLLSRLRNFLAG